MNKKKQIRSSNFELFRIILIIFVIFEHYNNNDLGGALRNPDSIPKINFYFLNLINSLSACAVDCFFIISGFFLYKREEISIRKITKVTFVYISYNVFSYLIKILLKYEAFSFRRLGGAFLPDSYYLLMYCSILMLCPFINSLLDSIYQKNKKNLHLLMLIYGILFVVYPTISDFFCDKFNISYMGMSNITIIGNAWGYNIITFIYMYLIGAYIHYLINLDFDVFTKNVLLYLLLYLCFSILIYFSSFISNNAMYYSNIFVVFQAISLFLFFQKIKIKSRFINYIAESVWGIYCIHLSITWFWNLFKCELYSHNSFSELLRNFLVTTIAVFVICCFLDKFLSIILIPCDKLANKIKLLNYKIHLYS